MSTNRIFGNGGSDIEIPASLTHTLTPITLASPRIILPFDCAYCGTTYYAMNDNGEIYVKLSERAMARRLRKHNIENTGEALEYITQHFAVEYAGPIAGYPIGRCTNNGIRCLVTTAAPKIEPMKGNWSTIKELLDGLLGYRQMCFFMAVMQAAVWRILHQTSMQIQAMALVGAPHIGKTFAQDNIVTPLLGRTTNPTQYALGHTAFSKDIGGAEHLMISDEHIHFSPRDRDRMYDYVKQITVNSMQRIHPKGGEAHQLHIRTLLTISCNASNSNDLKVIPNLDPLLRPRIHVFECQEGAKKLFKPTAQEKKEFQDEIHSQLPAFKYHLIYEWKNKEWMADPDKRFPSRAYHHPNIVTLLQGIAPETQLLEMMLAALFPGGGSGVFRQKCFRVTAAELLGRLRASDLREPVSKLVDSPRELGELLSKLKDTYPDIVTLDGISNGTRVWKITNQ